MDSLHELCEVRDEVFDPSRRDTVLNLTDLIQDRINPRRFFETNYVTGGMSTLLEKAFDRFSRRSKQGTFLLNQAMGGGKTHNMIALGLLAKHPELRDDVMNGYHDPNLGKIRVAAFTGRESDAPLGVWGAIANQIGKKEQFSDYYSPLSAPGQTAWENLLEGDPLLILLDELPPYFDQARAWKIGNADLATVTKAALSNLLVAVDRPKLENVCVVISDLTATYGEGSQQITEALHDLKNESGRGAMELEPVQQNTNEIYHILRKQIFESLPPEEEIQEVAQAYAQSVEDAKQMDVTDASPEEYARRIRDAYPFHFSIRDLYARFRENPGFQQTRDLIRLMRTVVARLYDTERAKEKALVHPYDLDLNHKDTLTEVTSINPKLENAISHDIASDGSSVAETIDEKRGGRDAQDAATLLLMASLANVPDAVRGLTRAEVISQLCTPGRDVSRIEKEVLKPFYTSAWYLHTDTDGRLLFKDVQNINARLKTTSESYGRESRLVELRDFLAGLFEPSIGDVYQRVQALPAVDDITVTSDKVTLILAEPSAGSGLSEDLRTFYDDQEYQNRVLFLTGQESTLQHLLEKSARLKAIRHILEEMKVEKVSENDPQYTSAQEIQDEIKLQLLSAARETFTTLLFPHFNGLRSADFVGEFTDNNYNGEGQIRSTLEDKGKFTADIESDSFLKKCEDRLFTQKQMLWSEVKRRAAINTEWPWHRPNALRRLKERMLHEDQWRQEGNYVNKGPFPSPETSVRVREIHRDHESGEVTLRLTPEHGDTIYYEVGAEATEASAEVTDPQAFTTEALKVSFLCVDSEGEHETGDPVEWTNDVTIKHQVYSDAEGKKKVELKAVPEVPIRYTTDGSNPRQAGGKYDEPVEVEEGTQVVQAVAEGDGVVSEPEKIRLDWTDDGSPGIQDDQPALWKQSHQLGTTKEAYDFLNRMQKWDAVAKGPRITVDSDEWVELAFDQEMEIGGERLEEATEYVRGLIDDGEVSLNVDALRFERGQQLRDWAEDAKADLNPDEVEQ
ncbi:hypothetical protein GGQ20_001660 [Salinibacter ruber]|uniref:DUF499 domain-containing protein n=1 Tax=Salinibacter ruber TaxID=146919 RepID=UPI002167D7C5|nr:DUF499 domain-containing protein [Salinibacter ruber]MCS3700351.1 hypothetical protein [Salinibacter ruber]